jgi:putative ABC transport system permease protein
LLAREWRSGELGVLLSALIVAVAALTGVGFLVDRIERSVALRANEVLAADYASNRRTRPRTTTNSKRSDAVSEPRATRRS